MKTAINALKIITILAVAIIAMLLTVADNGFVANPTGFAMLLLMSEIMEIMVLFVLVRGEGRPKVGFELYGQAISRLIIRALVVAELTFDGDIDIIIKVGIARAALIALGLWAYSSYLYIIDDERGEMFRRNPACLVALFAALVALPPLFCHFAYRDNFAIVILLVLSALIISTNVETEFRTVQMLRYRRRRRRIAQ
ncbi:MAG: hypothetical protein K5837_05005 [Candidatus Saccharibacteria bacterium]|nr:hypothetical protein [Candidatus Saccharibacteria bacterium]